MTSFTILRAFVQKSQINETIIGMRAAATRKHNFFSHASTSYFVLNLFVFYIAESTFKEKWKNLVGNIDTHTHIHTHTHTHIHTWTHARVSIVVHAQLSVSIVHVRSIYMILLIDMHIGMKLYVHDNNLQNVATSWQVREATVYTDFSESPAIFPPNVKKYFWIFRCLGLYSYIQLLVKSCNLYLSFQLS